MVQTDGRESQLERLSILATPSGRAVIGSVDPERAPIVQFDDGRVSDRRARHFIPVICDELRPLGDDEQRCQRCVHVVDATFNEPPKFEALDFAGRLFQDANSHSRAA